MIEYIVLISIFSITFGLIMLTCWPREKTRRQKEEIERLAKKAFIFIEEEKKYD